MTKFDALKLDDDDALTIAYQSGYYDGKKAAAQEPTKYSFKAHWEEDGCIGVVAAIERLDGGVHLLKDIIDAPQPAQEREALKLALEFVEDVNFGEWQGSTERQEEIITAIKEALAQPAQEKYTYGTPLLDAMTKDHVPPPPAQEPVAWCSQCGHKCPLPAQEPWRESASDYERGVIDGRQMQAQSSVDKAVNAMTQRPWVGLTDDEFKKIIDDAGFTRTDLLMIGACVEQLVDLLEATLRSKNT